MDKQIYIQEIPSIELGEQTYTLSDNSLIASFNTDIVFNPETDYVEYFIYNANKDLIDSVEQLRTYAIYGEDLSLNPEQDLESRAYLEGKYYTAYNFLRPLLSSSILEPYFISEVSTDRTEIRLSSTSVLGGDIVDSATALKAAITIAPFQKDFYLNFGQNTLVIANNILLDQSNPEDPSVLIKLYEPLPAEFGIQSQCWAVEKIANSKAYLVDIVVSYAQEDSTIRLKGPNTNIQLAAQSNKSTEYQNTTSLKETTNTSLKYQLNSVLAETGVELNIDYSDYSKFVFFSSAQTRLENFYYKLGLIEEYTVSASYGAGSSDNYITDSINYWNNKIDEVITNFDGYEYYLYFESSSTAWPKTNSTPPYINESTTSTQGLTWINAQLLVAQTYDENNKDGLVSSIPLYIQEDSANADYELFVEMIGQHFDSIWVYTEAVTEKYNTNNKVDSGLSKDLIGTALKDFGIKLYENSYTSDNLYNTYLGYTPSGSLLPYIGQELITTYVTASVTGSIIPTDNLSSEVYKRIYHNLPYLLKKKGTVEGLNTLITTFGIPDTILRVYEYGGKDQNVNTFDQWQQQYDLTFYNTGSSYVTSSFTLNSTWGATSNKPQAVEFRFKTEGIPAATHYSQSLWSTNNGAAVILKYNGSGYTSGSYTGSIVDPYYQYGVLEFYPSSSNTAATASIYLPFFDGGWWSVLVNKNSSTEFALYAKNSLYNGNDGNTLGFQASSSVTLTNPWTSAVESYLGKSSLSSKIFSGSLQELRYYTQPISESTFDAYVMNPSSIEQSEFLAFRASLGGELYTASISIHPKVSGEQVTTSSFSSNSNFYISGSINFIPNVETVFYDQVVAGIKNAVSDKVRVGNTNLYGTVLSGLGTLQQNYPTSQSYTRDVNYLEVGFSPQNEINEDINSQFGYFNIGEYIGDPRFISESNYRYPALDQLSLGYFKKYSSSYNYVDYLRLIKFFDNSLFKLIKDFIPARTAAATGVIIKQHLLERNRQRPAQVDYTQPEYTGSVTSLARDYQTGSIEVFTGGAGGSVNVLTNISQSWTSSILTKAGLVTEIESSQYEFYNGDYSGSSIECQLSYSLNTTPLLNNVSSSRLSTIYEDIDYGTNAFSPVNLTYIQSGSASLAPVQDSNYALTSSWSQIRYEGSANTGNYNTSVRFASQSQAPGYPIDKFSNYFARFSYDASSNPEYPGGGVFKLVELVGIDGTRVPLTGDNKYIQFVSEIFKAGKTVTAYGRDVSTVKTVTGIQVVEGGGYYQTMLLRSGSSPVGLNIGWSTGVSTGAQGNFVTSSNLTLTDSASIGNTGFIYTLQNNTSATYGTIVYMDPQAGIQVYNKSTDSYAVEGGSGDTWRVSYGDTLFPLRYGDFIRFGNTGSYSFTNTGSLDDTFIGAGLYYIRSLTTGSDVTYSSSIHITPALRGETINLVLPTSANNQNYRIIRRIENETWVTTKLYAQMNVDPTVGGLLIPEDFNPAYDPISVARQAGIEL